MGKFGRLLTDTTGLVRTGRPLTHVTLVALTVFFLLVFVFTSVVADRFDKDQRPYEFTDGGIVLKPGQYTMDDLLAILNSFLPKSPEPVLVLVHDGHPTAHYESIVLGSQIPDPTPMAASLAASAAGAPASPAAPPAAPIASGWTLIKFPQGQPLCTGVGFIGPVYYDRLDCGFGYVQVSETNVTDTTKPFSIVKVSFIDSSGTTREVQTTTRRTANNAWQFTIFSLPPTAWVAGPVTIRVTEVDTDGAGPNPNQVGNFGETTFFLNQLGASISPTSSGYVPGDPVTVTGITFEIDQIPPLAAAQATPVGATFSIQVRLPTGQVRGPYGPFTASDSPGPGRGTFTETLPNAATAGVTGGQDSGFKVSLSLEVVNATYLDAVTGAWAATRAGAGSVTINVPPTTLVVENSFVSAVGWVKPGDTYPFRLFVKNFRSAPESNAVVTVPVVDGTTFTMATPVNGSGTCVVNGGGGITWNIGPVAGAGPGGPTIKTCVVLALADTTAQDVQIVWKNLSSTATLTYTGGPVPSLTSTSHGPKVIPERATFDTARYGDRPFPVVPVDYFERKHDDTHTGDGLSAKINSADIAGSTFNLYQEMSYGQLFPHGTVPSTGIGTAGWNVDWKGDRYTDNQFQFTSLMPQGTCKGNTYKGFTGTAVLPERIVNGWYQMPGDTEYYGGDRFGSALVGAVAGIGAIFAIDDACGPTGKAVYDAAHIADPEIDYSDYDTDKDGVVDFFMMVFVGVGGNGVSQTSIPPYDNIWPHSSSLEFYYTDPGTGLKGYISDDQLRNLQGQPLFYTDATRTTMTTSVTPFRVYVRVGPYNVNPESAIDRASVISHEYGHSLGLPDFYSGAPRATYGDWNLMATDKSQNMDVFGKQELGWLIPRTLPLGTTTVTGWQDSKRNTKQIDWVTPGGVAYTLSGPSVNNGQGYAFKLPSRQILDPAKFNAAGPGEGATPDHVWWSEAGNDFGCAPQTGHNLDVFLPELASLPAATQVTVTFKSYWDIEWDFDYGFVLASADGGETYQSLESANGYTTPQAQNPTANSCQAAFGNGITGTSGSYEAGTQELDRVISNYPDGGFLTDKFDLTPFVGESTVLRFSYSTDPGLTRPGWFIDDLKVTAGAQVIYETDFESSGSPDDPRMFNGGCKALTRTAPLCTDGWQYVSATAGSPADHAYYLEMRDRSGFDFDGKGENDRAPIAFAPGLLLVYTDEAHCYGNFGCPDPPGQSPLDSQPQPGNNTPDLNDAAFTEVPGDDVFSDSITPARPGGWIDNYADPNSRYNDDLWHFDYNCLTFDVVTMMGRGLGPATVPPYDLTGDVTFTIGPGCVPFDFGHNGGGPNTPPTAVAQARPTNPTVGQTVEFDGSQSFDQETATSDLFYEWDFDGDGTYDATGQTAMHVYTATGTFNAKLRVTDDDPLKPMNDTDVIVITVSPEPTGSGPRVHGSGHIAGATPKQPSKFEFSASTKSGATSGKIHYDNTQGGLNLRGSVTFLLVTGSTAEFRGSCTYSGGSCTYTVNIQDNADPGKNKDRFAISVFDFSGKLVYQRGGLLLDGNIKIREK